MNSQRQHLLLSKIQQEVLILEEIYESSLGQVGFEVPNGNVLKVLRGVSWNLEV